MTVVRKSRLANYSDQERRVLLTGVPTSSRSTRFGHPNLGWNSSEIHAAWLRLSEELADPWSSPEYAVYRKRDPRPFAVRHLEGEE